ncbi:hypothetical protein [Streptomyces sp. JW3]|uniref:hypothetical protein n=1 Tax=Streptomyces sp. JW3 TaxID=3456955 RepID=UPI003FA42D81
MLAPAGDFRGHGDWSAGVGVLMTVEITSYDEEADRLIREVRPDAYAAVGIPVHLVIDRADRSTTVLSQPEGGRHRRGERLPFGATVRIPGPVDITLETEPLNDLL